MEAELRSLAQAINQSLLRIGVRTSMREGPMGVEYRMLIPTTPRKLLVVARVAMPDEQVGKVFGKGGKFRKAAKTVAKKLAKSKVLGKVVKIAKMMPGPVGQTLRAASAATTAAKAIAKAAKKGNPKAKAFAAKAAKKLTVKLRASSKVIKPAPGYPNPVAATQPGPVPGNGFGDSQSVDELEQAEAMQEAFEAPGPIEQDPADMPPVEVDASDEGDEPSDDTYAEDDTADDVSGYGSSDEYGPY